MKNFSHENIFACLFFLALIFVGLFTYKDYGYTRDEAVNRWRGIVSANYIGHLWNVEALKDTDPLGIEKRNQFSELSPTEAEHGSTFEIVSAIAEKIVFGAKSPSEQALYFLRHFLLYLFYLGGVYAVYSMARRRFSDWRIALLTAMMFVLSPRIYGNAYFNSMDIAFLSTFALAANSSINLLINTTIRNSVIAGVCVGLAIATRCLAIVIPFMVVGVEIIRWLLKTYAIKSNPTKKSIGLLIYLIACALSTYCFWPWLWEDPFNRIVQAFRVMSNIPFELEVLYFGKIVSSFSIPWHYVLTWIGITTPILYLLGFFFGVFIIARNLFAKKFLIFADNIELQDIFYLGLLLGPLLSVIILRSPLYDGWRHLFFVYPFLILIAANGYTYLWNQVKHSDVLKKMFLGVISLSLLMNGYWMLKSHPFESLYFNSLVGKGWKNKFDVDYWSLGVRPALEYIVRHDERSIIKVGGLSALTDLSASRMLDPSERARIVEAKSELTADYMLQIYRIDNRGLSHIGSNFVLYHEIKIGNEVVLSIYKNSNGSVLLPVQLNEVITFSKQGKGSNYLVGIGLNERIGSSWHYPEPWGVWSATSDVSIVLPKPSQAARELQLEIIRSPMLSASKQEIEIFVNQQYNQKISLERSKPAIVTILLDPKFDIYNYVLVEFRQGDSLNWDKRHTFTDNRWLGIGVVSAIFK